jgi:hypothetical protein
MSIFKKKNNRPRKNKHEEAQPIKCIDISEDKKTILLWR